MLGAWRSVAMGGAASAALVACSAVFDPSELSAGVPAPGDPDGASPSVDGATKGSDGQAALDADVTDAGGDAPTVPTCSPPAFFCESYETGDLSQWTQKHLLGKAGLDVVSNPVHSGQFALRAHRDPNDAGTASEAQTELRPAPLSSGTFAMRAWLLLPTKLPEDTLLLAIRASSSDAAELRLAYDKSGSLFAGTRVNGSGTATVYDFTTGTLPVGQWTCVEWIVTLGAAGRHKILFNKETVLDAPRDTLGPTQPAYDEIKFGYFYSSTVLPASYHVDDVVFSTAPIGCE